MYVVVNPPSGARTLSSTAAVSTASGAAIVDFVSDNDSAAVKTDISAALEPLPSSGTPGAASGGGGGGVFGVIPLVALGMFGVWVGYRRRVGFR